MSSTFPTGEMPAQRASREAQEAKDRIFEMFRPQFEDRAFSLYFVKSIRFVPDQRFGLQTDPEMNLTSAELLQRERGVVGDPKPAYLRPEIDAMWTGWKMLIEHFSLNGYPIAATCTICAPGSTDSPGFAEVCVANDPGLQDIVGMPWKCDGKCKLSMELGDLIAFLKKK